MSKAQISEWLKVRGQELGFSMLAITPAQPSTHLAAYLEWVKQGMHGTMTYLARNDRLERRQDLNVIVPNAKSMIIVAYDYLTAHVPAYIAEDPTRGRISNYSWGADYHDVLLDKLNELATQLVDRTNAVITHKAYVDTGAIIERSHAEQAGLGFFGKNTMLIHPRHGSFFFLGEIITDLELIYDEPVSMPTCGSCTRCLEACPTDAFPTPYTLDARRCISYLTIEYKGFIERALRPLIGNWVYGCDICQLVCPWQRFAEAKAIAEFSAASMERVAPPLSELLMLDELAFSERFTGSPIKRIKRERLVRNACIAAGNSQHKEFETQLTPLLSDSSPLVRGHAAWALGQLHVGRQSIEEALAVESDTQVINEFHQALGEFQ